MDGSDTRVVASNLGPTAETEDSSSSQVGLAIATDDVIGDASFVAQVNTSEDSQDSVTGVLDKDGTTRSVDILEERLRELELRFAGEPVLPEFLFFIVQNKL